MMRSRWMSQLAGPHCLRPELRNMRTYHHGAVRQDAPVCVGTYPQRPFTDSLLLHVHTRSLAAMLIKAAATDWALQMSQPAKLGSAILTTLTSAGSANGSQAGKLDREVLALLVQVVGGKANLLSNVQVHNLSFAHRYARRCPALSGGDAVLAQKGSVASSMCERSWRTSRA
ncbi:hypothetical protein T492DRAFT_1112871 [Pavlovales sp. CCMP2436]|nr:hypothetical protein T492DRAFT_1112871 [Pavlovales sp. CCMP2436]|mmetsp:Transcript_25062/g.63596  ORF Transcript_25062/g.63596 Transcript_25062/m.63596 type:complete len:172 (+) Transcript_25062:305-820(+)